MPDELTLAEAAKYLGLPAKTVEQLVAKQELPGRKVGDEYRFRRSSLEAWIDGRNGNGAVLKSAGALAGDPYFPQIIDDIYARRKQASGARD